jgi:hypothetical protein
VNHYQDLEIMLTTSRARRALALLVLITLPGALAFGQPPSPLPVPYSEVHTVAGPSVGVPLEYSVSISTAGTYTIQLTDLGAALQPPAPLGSVKLALTNSSGQVVMLTPASSSSASSELIGAGSATFSASTGSYLIHVVGAPGTAAGSGPVGIQVSDSQRNPVQSFSGTLALPPASIPNNIGTLYDTLTVLDSTYTITLSDLSFPQSLTTLALTIVNTTTGMVTPVTPASGTLCPGSSSSWCVTVHELPGQCTIVAAGQAGTLNAGLYSVTISPSAGGAPVYSKTIPVGGTALLGSPTLSAASYTLAAADLKYPAALAQLGAVVVLNGRPVAQIATTGGSQMFTGSAVTCNQSGPGSGCYQVFGVALPSAGSSTLPSTGSYAVTLLPSAGSPLIDVARAVASAGSGVTAYSYDTTASSSQPYELDLNDFGYPSPLAYIVAVAAQGIGPTGVPALLNPNPTPGPGSHTFTPASGPVSLLVFAQPASSSTDLFGLSWEPSGVTPPTFETTQAVGKLFSTRTINVASAGNYQVTVADLGFPETFGTLAVQVTRGTSQAGSVFSAGSFTFPATPGNYDINIIAAPGNTTTDQAGTYSISVATAPPLPTISFTSTPMSVASGGTVKLSWSVQNASSCTLSGGGLSPTSEPVTGSATSPALTANSTFTLSCSGAGGTANQSLMVNVTPPSGGGGGGGGAVGGDLLTILLGAAGLRAWLSATRRRTNHGC